MARVRGWSALLLGLQALGLVMAPMYPVAPRLPQGPPHDHPEEWNPHRPISPAERELWARTGIDVTW